MTALRFLLFGAIVIVCGGSAFASPTPSFNQFNEISQPQGVTAVRYDYDCRIDYPCRGRPYPRPRSYYRRETGGSVYIGRNYGTVNIRIDGRRPVHRRPRYRDLSDRYPSACDDRCGADDWRRRGYPDRAPAAAIVEDGAAPIAIGCGGYPCDQNCGPSCWYNRFKSGYCGHGCDTYRTRVRFETEDRTIKVPKVIVETPPRPIERDEAFAGPDRTRDLDRSRDFEERRNFEERRDVDRSRDRDGRRDYDRARDADERAGRERYQGPAYPVQ